MPNLFGRSIQDYELTKSIALSNGAGTVTTAVLDLGVSPYKSENVELEISVPALNATMAPDTRTATLSIESSTTSAFSAVDKVLCSQVYTGAGGVGIAASSVVCRLPSDCARYIRGKVVLGASTGDATTISATFKILT